MGKRKNINYIQYEKNSKQKNFYATQMQIDVAWSSIEECAGNKFCIDPWGRKISRNQYGKKSEYGWNIDHIMPRSKGGSDDNDNLQPLHWKSNKEKGDNPNCGKWTKC